MRAIYDRDEFRPRRFQAEWLPDSSGYTVLESAPDAKEKVRVRYDLASGQRTVLDAAQREEPGRSGRLSPDGASVVFSEQGNLYVRNVNSDRKIPLTKSAPDGPVSNSQAVWSPDGKWITFVRSPDQGRSEHQPTSTPLWPRRHGSHRGKACDHEAATSIPEESMEMIRTAPQALSTLSTLAALRCFAPVATQAQDFTCVTNNGTITITGCASLTSIGEGALAECNNLSGVYFEDDAPSLGWNAFKATSPTVYYLPGTTGWGPTYGGRPTALWGLRFSVFALNQLDLQFNGFVRGDDRYHLTGSFVLGQESDGVDLVAEDAVITGRAHLVSTSSLPGGMVLDPQGPATGSLHAIRRGSWVVLPQELRAASRKGDPDPGWRDFGVGFRLVLVPGQP